MPTFELAELRSGRRARALIRACTTGGYLRIRTPQVSRQVTVQALREAGRFFALPLAQRLALRNSGRYRGYIPLQDDTWECMEVGEPAPHALVHPGFLFDAPSQWPAEHQLPGWRSALTRVQGLMRSIAEEVLRAVLVTVCGSRGAGLVDDTASTLRLLRYRAAPNDRAQMQLEAHTDSGYLTLILQDDVGGLQILDRDQVQGGEWRDVAPAEGVICFVGDMLHVLSDGHAIAPLHRTIIRTPRPRLSLAYFLEPASGQRIAPLHDSKPASDEAPGVVYGEFLRDKIRTEFARQYDRVTRA